MDSAGAFARDERPGSGPRSIRHAGAPRRGRGAAGIPGDRLPGQALQARALSSDPAKRIEQIKRQKDEFTKQKEQKIAPLKLKYHKDLNDRARVQVDKYLKQLLTTRYPELSFPRDYKELYVSDVADLPTDPNFYTLRVDYVVTLKNQTPGTATNVWHRCFTLDGNLKVVGSKPAALEEQEVRKTLGTSASTTRPTREQLKKEAAELKEMKRKPPKPEKPEPNP